MSNYKIILTKISIIYYLNSIKGDYQKDKIKYTDGISVKVT